MKLKPSINRHAALLAISCAFATPGNAQDYVYEKEPFNYWSAPIGGPITKLSEKIDKGTLQLPLQNQKELVGVLLKELDISADTQVVVFSKTSVQRNHITPSNPRAIYFNDQTYMGFVPGAMVEFTHMDPVLGGIFYQLDPDRPDRKIPKLDRSEGCMTCHASGMTDRLPGLMIRSIFPDEKGEPIYQAGTSLIDQNSPLETRWGGWYVTGGHGSLVHRGNAIATMKDGNAILDTKGTLNVTTLDKFFDVSKFPRNTSDIVALLVLEHQVGMHNRLLKASYDVRGAIERRTELLKELGEPQGEGLTGSALSVAKSHVEKILEFLLFSGEAALPEGGVEGNPAFVTAFQKNKRETKDGKSLKDLQLLNRMFKYRCSYLIYSPEWDELPKPFLDMLYHRLFEILTSKEPIKGYEHLADSEREAILKILRETKSGLPAEWKA